MSIDWDNAPKGAEYYDKHLSIFYKTIGDDLFFISIGSYAWLKSEHKISEGFENYADIVKRPQPSAAKTTSNGNTKYNRELKQGVFVDVYDVLKAFDVTNPALQHLIKKALACGNRGHKDLMTDHQDIIDSAVRAKQLAESDG